MHECRHFWRRARSSPNRDALHVLRVGLMIDVVLWVVLPSLLS